MRFFLTLPLYFLMASPGVADAPRVAADILPVHGLVARVMDGVGTPDLVVPGAASAHAYDLRPSEAAMLDEADIVFWMGEALTPWLSDAIETLAADAQVVTLLETQGTMLLPFREDDGFDDAHGGHEHEHEHDHDSAEEAADPHAWLDPVNAAFWLDVIAEALAQVDPANAEAYSANADAGRAEIAQALADAEALLAGAETIRFLVSHDAYQYFESRFDLAPTGAITLGDAAAPGPARIARLQEQLIETGTSCVLIEPQTNPSQLRSLNIGPEVKIIEIDPLGTGLAADTAFYPALITALAASFNACR